MFTSGPPSAAGTSGTLHISRVERMSFDGPAACMADPEHTPNLREYVSDLALPYRLPLREEPFTYREGHSYGEMAAALVGATVPADQPVDLLVLAFAVPDVRPGRSTATYLSQVCPGHPLAFAVSDQGPAAAFTGLRLARDYLSTGGCQRALLLVVEQATPLYDTPAADVPARHCAVAVLCERAGPARVTTVRQHPGVAPGQAGPLLATELATLTAPGPGPATVILAGGLAPEALEGVDVRVAPSGQPSTGPWWELAGALPGPTRPEPTVLAGYDPGLGYLCLSTIGGDSTTSSGP